MKYKWISMIAKGSVFLITLAVVLIMVIPLYSYQNKPNLEVSMKQYTSGDEAVKWLADHYKVKPYNGNNQPDLLYVKDAAFLERVDLNEINHNMVVLEALFQQVIESKYLINKLNYLTGVETNHFIGKTYEDLAELDAIPAQIISRYKSNHKNEWPFYGEGIIITSLEDVIVLTKGKDYKGSLMLRSNLDGVNSSIPYYGSFEITESLEPAIANFNLRVTASGNEKLGAFNISPSFPAVYQISRNYFNGYYLAGDFTSNAILLGVNYDLTTNMMQNKVVYEKFTGEQIFWQFTAPFYKSVLNRISSETKTLKKVGTPFTVEDMKIMMRTDSGDLKPFFIKGINLGAALPGRYFTEFPLEKENYSTWLDQMGKLNINTIRVYTLLSPSFYQALYEYNLKADTPIYLLQEIWPEENPKNLNYLGDDYNRVYKQEIEYAIDAIHGNIEIPQRDFRASGLFSYDVSPYLLGYLVGREMEPEEVIATNELNEDYTFQGEYFYSERNASPTESWLAASCDYALAYEAEKYQGNPLIGIVNWPTLDALSHDSEWNASGDKSLQFNDKVSVDIDRIGINRDNVNGFFGAYHIYPNYPNFMNNDTDYANYYDSEGVFRYGGYLEAFMKQNHRYPAIVAEYGISTSSVTAHYSPDGLDHGGKTEEEQASMIIRMTKAILKENYSGAIIFEWMDEWAKKTWTTEFYMIPYERQVLWHNVLDPEQNYGILANEAIAPQMKEIFSSKSPYLSLKRVQEGQNASYLYIKLDFNERVDLSQNIKIAFDLKTDEADSPSFEFLLKLSEAPELLVTPSYNWLKGRYQSQSQPFETFENLIQIVNPENTDKQGVFVAEKSIDLSQFRIGDFTSAQNYIWIEDNQVTVRVPYGLLGIADPSSRRVLWDSRVFIPTSTDSIETLQIEKINLRVMKDQMRPVDLSLTLDEWELPLYNSRLKSGVEKISDFFKAIQ